jgi:hypothetical protein
MEPMQEAFAAFLLCNKKGPKIDHETANLLWHCGIVNEKMLVTFSKLSIQTVLTGLTTWELENLNAPGFIKLLMYAEYINDYSIITKDGSLN